MGAKRRDFDVLRERARAHARRDEQESGVNISKLQGRLLGLSPRGVSALPDLIIAPTSTPISLERLDARADPGNREHGAIPEFGSVHPMIPVDFARCGNSHVPSFTLRLEHYSNRSTDFRGTSLHDARSRGRERNVSPKRRHVEFPALRPGPAREGCAVRRHATIERRDVESGRVVDVDALILAGEALPRDALAGQKRLTVVARFGVVTTRSTSPRALRRASP